MGKQPQALARDEDQDHIGDSSRREICDANQANTGSRTACFIAGGSSFQGGRQAFVISVGRDEATGGQSGGVGAHGGEADDAPGNCKKSLALCEISTPRKRELVQSLGEGYPGRRDALCSTWRAAANYIKPSRARSTLARGDSRWLGRSPLTGRRVAAVLNRAGRSPRVGRHLVRRLMREMDLDIKLKKRQGSGRTANTATGATGI